MLDPLYEGLKEPSSENLQAPYYVHRKKISNDTFRKSFEVTLRSGEKILSQQKKWVKFFTSGKTTCDTRV